MEGLLDDLWDEMTSRGRIYECSLRSTKWQVNGLQMGDCVYIDPRPAILEILVHELLHRRKPRWGERRVTREAKALVLQMDEETKKRWWRAYQKIKKKSVPLEVAE